jgi:large subunit ribosomal protein L35
MKLKTHKGAAKRFKITAGGKVKRRHSFARHILTKKAAGRKRKLSKATIASDPDSKIIRRMLPYAEIARLARGHRPRLQ